MAPSPNRPSTETTRLDAERSSAEFDRRKFLAASAASTLWAASSSFSVGFGDEPAAKPDQPPANEPDRFRRGENLQFRGLLPLDSQRANAAFSKFLRENARASDVLHRLDGRVRQFLDNSPRMMVSKCIDGRMHGSNEKGFPPTAVVNVRTEGNNVDLSANNSTFWNRLHSVILDANRHTENCPALFLALGHHGVLGSGCAAHHENDEAALETVRQQAADLRARFPPSELFVLHGMINTDDSSIRLIFPDGHEVSAAQIIRRLDAPDAPLADAIDCFQPDFLDGLLDDRETSMLVRGQTPRKLLEGRDAPLFHDLQVMLAMEAYLATELWHVVHNRSRNNVVFEPRLMKHVIDQLAAVADLPQELKAPFVYTTLWNVAHTLHARKRLATMEEGRERTLELQHAEYMVAYGEGYETEPRNTLVLVKPGRGNDVEALAVARQVITLHRNRRQEQRHPPLVQINVEVSGALDTWQSFNVNVLSKLMTMVDNVHAVFNNECRILTSYSYREQKRFYPVRLHPDPTLPGADVCSCFPSDVGQGLNVENFSHNDLRLREDNYSRSILAQQD